MSIQSYRCRRSGRAGHLAEQENAPCIDPTPDYTRLLTALRGGQPDRVPLLELIVDPEIRAAYLGRPLQTVADDIAFWHAAGYDCFAVYPNSPTLWFFLDDQRADTIIADDHTATGQRRWASEGRGLILGLAGPGTLPGAHAGRD